MHQEFLSKGQAINEEYILSILYHMHEKQIVKNDLNCG